MTISILIADDSNLFRYLLKRYLEQEEDMSVVADVGSGKEAISKIQQLRPNVAILDINMPDGNGIEVAQEISHLSPHTRVILLTDHLHLITLGSRIGDWTSLSKDCDLPTLCEAIHKAVRETHKRPSQSPNYYTETIRRVITRYELTEREGAVLRAVVEDAASSTQIASELSRVHHQPITENSVKQALNRIMTKMNVEPRTRVALVKMVTEGDHA